ncbi:hypothetical protein SLA2020_110870 [Shorea laevis]
MISQSTSVDWKSVKLIGMDMGEVEGGSIPLLALSAAVGACFIHLLHQCRKQQKRQAERITTSEGESGEESEEEEESEEGESGEESPTPNSSAAAAS